MDTRSWFNLRPDQDLENDWRDNSFLALSWFQPFSFAHSFRLCSVLPLKSILGLPNALWAFEHYFEKIIANCFLYNGKLREHVMPNFFHLTFYKFIFNIFAIFFYATMAIMFKHNLLSFLLCVLKFWYFF